MIKTAGRVFEVLEYFRQVRRPLSVRELSEHFGYPLSSTSALVKSIATLGYLSYDSRLRAYSPTILLAMLGDWIYDLSFNRRELIDLLKSVADATGETAILAIQNDVHAQYVQVIQSRQAVQFFVSPGSRRPLCASGLGWALLTGEDDAGIARIYQRTESQMGKAVLPDDLRVEDVLAQVHKVRQQGYAYSRSINTPGVGVIALPLPPSSKGPRLALGIGGLVERLDVGEKAAVRRMKECVSRYVEEAR